MQQQREEKTEEQKEKEITNEDFKKRRSKRETRTEAVEEGKRMTVEHVTKKESETGEILKKGWLKMQSETLNEDIKNESEKTSDSQPQEQSEHHHDGRKGENITQIKRV